MSSKGNSGTIVFALVVTTLSAALLAAAATILKPAQDENVLKEKQQNILSLVGLNGPNDYKKFDQLVQGLVIDQEGQQVQGVEALALDLALEKKLNTKNPAYKVRYPMYVYRNPRGQTTYLLQVAGTGLWGPIWGYLALVRMAIPSVRPFLITKGKPRAWVPKSIPTPLSNNLLTKNSSTSKVILSRSKSRKESMMRACPM
ncbi:MAG: hypothetical protein FJ336_04155, partial [Sphingomonadales bacterium]|nr:hypothetical protein [Sphingomonadales bacterium]